VKISKAKLRQIIKEELNEVTADAERLARLARSQEIEPGITEADSVYGSLQEMIIEIEELTEVINNISMEHGAFAHVTTYAKMARGAIAKLLDKLEGAIHEQDREY